MKFLIFILAIVFLGCSHVKVTSNTMPVYYSDKNAVTLLPTNVMTANLEMNQHLVGEFTKPDGKIDSFEAETWVLANDTILAIFLFGSFGTTLGEITYAKDSVHFESSLMDVSKFKAEYVLADFQICFYPFEILKKHFETFGFEFTEEILNNNSENFLRILKENDLKILTVEKIKNEIRLTNHLRNYKYKITLENTK